MKKVVKVALAAALAVAVLGVLFYGWAAMRTDRLLSRTVETHRAGFPVPFPLGPEERAELTGEVSPDSVALARAIERGRHLVQSRYACGECHGADFGGGVMVDDPLIGRLLAPNITTGRGSRTLGYETADWDRIVRHGVHPDGSPSAMPAQEFQRRSDRELSDIVAYLRSVPPVDAEVPPVRLGPLGTILLALGAIPLSVDAIALHAAKHPELPPLAEATPDFGRHLVGVCTGCHGADLVGGRVPGGDPSWPPASNLTPHADGIGDWTLEQFVEVMRTGRRPDGTELLPPMDGVVGYTRNMTDIELAALWAYLETVPAVATE